ncbi:hypothetical protein ABIF74_004127 [Bradyrhizobium japonicum]
MEVEKLAITKLELKAGDVLVVQLNRRQPTEVMNRLRDSIPAGHFKFLRVWSVKFLHPRGRTRDC